ncbi:MAG: TatD family hydrolase [Candidatus Paceibacterota bacterium]
MEVKYIDAHCHVQFEQYDTDREEVIERMREQGVVGIVVGCGAESSQKAIALAEEYEHLYAAVGHHPNHLEEFEEDKIRELLSRPRVVAVGECGLDYFRPADVTEDVKAKQNELLRKHIALAAEFDKPLIIHARPSKGTSDAYTELIEILAEAKTLNPNLRGDVHFFVGGEAEARALIALGFTVSFTAVITFARDYDAVIKVLPLESILSETDAPYVAPASRRGERNDSLAVVEVVASLAKIRGEDVGRVRVQLCENARRLFALG